ncbi:hypothetical protein [Actinoallomurus sp. NPDC052274]
MSEKTNEDPARGTGRSHAGNATTAGMWGGHPAPDPRSKDKK